MRARALEQFGLRHRHIQTAFGQNRFQRHANRRLLRTGNDLPSLGGQHAVATLQHPLGAQQLQPYAQLLQVVTLHLKSSCSFLSQIGL